MPVPFSFLLLAILRDSVLFTSISKKHRIIQCESDLRGSLVQLHAQNRVSYEIRPDCSGL